MNRRIILGLALILLGLLSKRAVIADERVPPDVSDKIEMRGRLVKVDPKQMARDLRNMNEIAQQSRNIDGPRNYASKFEPYIIGGAPADKLPHNVGRLAVAILFRKWSGEESFCTGTLVSPSQVLTAGHCGCGNPDSYAVWLTANFRDGHLPPIKLNGSPILYDRRICAGRAPFGSDLALLTLKTNVTCDEEVSDTEIESESGLAQPRGCTIVGDGITKAGRNLFSVLSYQTSDMVWSLRNRLAKGVRLTAIGYGYTEKGTYGLRLKTEIPVASLTCEEKRFASVCGAFAEMMLIYSDARGSRKDTCGGDSGGPVFLFEDVPRLIGVTSRAAPTLGNDNPQHCGGGGIYTLLGRRSVAKWLAAHGLPYKASQ